MGKCGSKSKQSKIANYIEEYDYDSAVVQFNEITKEAEDYIEQGQLREVFHCYRACTQGIFIMWIALAWH